MLTLFACPKPFTDPHIATIQRNAIASWKKLSPEPEIIILGDEEGVEEFCREMGVTHVGQIARNEYGTPLVSGLFEAAERVARNDILAYVNSDILLMSDWMETVRRVCKEIPGQFLLGGQRWDMDIKEKLLFDASWEERMKTRIRTEGKSGSPRGIDYFVFRKGMWDRMPPFALGRFWYDNWLLYRAGRLGAKVVDATEVVKVVHQNHGYAHHGMVNRDWASTPEARENQRLSSELKHPYTLEDVPWRLLPGGIKFSFTRMVWKNFGAPLARAWLKWIWYPLLTVTRPLRHPA